MKPQKDISEIIEKITENAPSVDEAIIKLNGYFKQYFWNNHLRIKMGELYLKKGDFVKAGKMLYFKDKPNEAEQRAIVRFKESCKNKHLLILRSFLDKAKVPRGIDVKMSYKIFNLILNVAQQEGSLPVGIVLWIYRYERIRSIEIEKGLIQNYSRNDKSDENVV
ncbi:MAG: hypothetical protein IPL35_10575 [Sphingobacteriales bacterium]|nr:hypothetical protein [Sphingobacteriales bacterium]